MSDDSHKTTGGATNTFGVGSIDTFDQIKPFMDQIIALVAQEMLPVIKEGLLIQKPIPSRVISRKKLEEAMRNISAELSQLQHLDPREPDMPKRAWKLLNKIAHVVVSTSGQKLSGRTDLILAMIKTNRRAIARLRRQAGLIEDEWDVFFRAVAYPYRYAWKTGADDLLAKRFSAMFQSRRIVPTMQTGNRVWKLWNGRWPQRDTNKLQRLARIYADSATIFEHLLRFHLELVSTLPASGVKSPGPKDTLGLLINKAKQNPILRPLAEQVDVQLRNSIQHGWTRVTVNPVALVWTDSNGQTLGQESLKLFKKRVERLLAIITLFAQAHSAAGFDVLDRMHKMIFKKPVSGSFSKTPIPKIGGRSDKGGGL